MTNEEAINHIRYSLIEEHYPLPKELGVEVLNMAIEALKNDKANAIKRDVWELYQRHQSHLATYVYEFGIELKELLGRYER